MNEGENTQTVEAEKSKVVSGGETPAETQSFYSGSDAATDDFADPEPQAPASSDKPIISWTASEFIAHQKTFGWYFALAVVIAVLAGLAYLWTPDITSVVVIIICGILFGIYAGHKPRELDYSIDSTGLNIAGKRYALEQFRSFAVIQEGAVSSITLLPLRRFAPSLTLYFEPQDEAPIAAILGDRLPLEERGHDPVDRLMRRIRF